MVVSKQAPHFPNAVVWGSAGISTPPGGRTRRIAAVASKLNFPILRVDNVVCARGDRYPDILFRTVAR